MNTIRKFAGALAATVLTVTLAACGSASSGSSPDQPLQVGASAVPHAEILNYVKSNLATKAGLKFEVKVFQDYVQPNTALSDGSLDANYFQTVPYLKDQQKQNPGFADFVGLKPVHVEPLGIYSKKVRSVAAVPAGAQVTLPNDPTNQGRALKLLAQAKLITLKATGEKSPTPLDIARNPKNLKVTPVEAANIPRTLQDTTIAVINGNYALEAKLVPAKDALLLEPAAGNPNANLVVVKKEKQTDPRVVKLEQLLHSPQVKSFITTKYSGAVQAAF